MKLKFALILLVFAFIGNSSFSQESVKKDSTKQDSTKTKSIFSSKVRSSKTISKDSKKDSSKIKSDAKIRGSKSLDTKSKKEVEQKVARPTKSKKTVNSENFESDRRALTNTSKKVENRKTKVDKSKVKLARNKVKNEEFVLLPDFALLDFNPNGVKLYSNQIGSELTIEFREEAEGLRFEIINVKGKTVAKNVVHRTFKEVVNIESFKKGAYFVRLKARNFEDFIKFVIR